MELKGFVRQGRNVAIVGAALGAVVGLTAPVASAEDAETWTMPTIKGELLQNAIDSVVAAAGEDNVKFNIYDRQFNQVVYNYTNWVVCAYNPGPEAEVPIRPGKPRTVTLALNRPSTGC